MPLTKISGKLKLRMAKNSNYLDSGFTIKNPEIYTQFDIKSGKFICTRFEENTDKFMFVPQPQLIKDVWKKIMPWKIYKLSCG